MAVITLRSPDCFLDVTRGLFSLLGGSVLRKNIFAWRKAVQLTERPPFVVLWCSLRQVHTKWQVLFLLELSVIRFGKILPIWQNLKSLCQFLRVYLVFGKNCYLLWQILLTVEQLFMVVNGQIMKTKKPYGHTAWATTSSTYSNHCKIASNSFQEWLVWRSRKCITNASIKSKQNT